MSDPKLSLVVTGRNDSYGGEFTSRFQCFIDNVLGLSAQVTLPIELVVVEWNPPADRPRFEEAMDWSALENPATVRIVEVPPEIHDKHENAEDIALFEYKAKNVGIRRAEADNVLTTNADIIFNHDLFEFLRDTPLRDDAFYRIDRHDMRPLLKPGMAPDEQIKICQDNVVRVHTRYGKIAVKPTDESNRWIFREYLRKLHPREAWRWFKTKFVYRIHAGAPGDFTLMSKEAWERIRGYPEFPTQRHIDTYACVTAMAAGLEQVVLQDPMRIYHQQHGSSEMAGRPQTDYEEFWEATTRMLDRGYPEVVNDTGWGLSEVDFPETSVSTESPRTG